MGRMRLEEIWATMAASYTAVYDAAIVYSEGEMGRLPIFQILGLEQGVAMKTDFRGIDRKTSLVC